MKRAPIFLCILATSAAWGPSSFAQQQTAVGPGITPLDAAGERYGVEMSGSATTGTLTVGVVGGPNMNIDTSNNPIAPGSVAISTEASSSGNIVFNSGSTVYGNIGVTQPGGPFLLDIAAGNTGTVVNFDGSVYATILNVTGTGTVDFKSGAINIMATNFAANGTIVLAPNTTLIGALTTTAGASTGTLSLGAGSTLNGAAGGAIGLESINVLGGSNRAGVVATITGAVDSFGFALKTNTLNIGGALTIANLAPSGVIDTTLASATVYGDIRVVGSTNLGPSLTIDVTVPATAHLTVGTMLIRLSPNNTRS